MGSNGKSDYVTMRIPRSLLEELRKRAYELELYLECKASLKQACQVKLAASRHERFGIAPWQIVSRLLAKEVAREERQRRYRQRKRK
ncbi:MAG: hypothetical protein CMJ58_15140 [Planctomycetaceae bacterium]|nr:hypothetical protein [Planctomycetaceae bacterium]